eukprot:352855-Pelagomonas_calceolata.AAC.1
MEQGHQVEQQVSCQVIMNQTACGIFCSNNFRLRVMFRRSIFTRHRKHKFASNSWRLFAPDEHQWILLL